MPLRGGLWLCRIAALMAYGLRKGYSGSSGYSGGSGGSGEEVNPELPANPEYPVSSGAALISPSLPFRRGGV